MLPSPQGYDSPGQTVSVCKRWLTWCGDFWLKLLSDALRESVILGGKVSKGLTLEAMCFLSQILCHLLLVLTASDDRTSLNSIQNHLSSSTLQQFRPGVLVSSSMFLTHSCNTHIHSSARLGQYYPSSESPLSSHPARTEK